MTLQEESDAKMPYEKKGTAVTHFIQPLCSRIRSVPAQYHYHGTTVRGHLSSFTFEFWHSGVVVHTNNHQVASGNEVEPIKMLLESPLTEQ